MFAERIPLRFYGSFLAEIGKADFAPLLVLSALLAFFF